MSMLDGNFYVDTGALRLILKWKFSMARLVNMRDASTIKELPQANGDVLSEADSSFHEAEQSDDEMLDGLSEMVASEMSPIESDGPEDKEKWNLFDEFLPLPFKNVEELNVTDNLSSMLRRWRLAKVCDSSLYVRLFNCSSTWNRDSHTRMRVTLRTSKSN